METSVLAPLYSISPKPTFYSREAAQDASSTGHHDFISFLGLMQYSGVDLLPIKWQPALLNLGSGGSACISQALINESTSFVFKRLFHEGLSRQTYFERLGKEALILRHVYLINHMNFIRLEAYCCEILKESKQISPVLIFEKFPLGSLQHFLLSDASKNVTFSERLRFCADIANALMALHRLCLFDPVQNQADSAH